MTIQDVGDGILVDLNPQFLQFTFKFAVPPIPVLSGKSDGQTFDCLVCPRASLLRLVLIGPFAFNQRSMPADDRLWFEDPNNLIQL